MRKRMKRCSILLCGTFGILLLCLFIVMPISAGSIYESEYVSFSPDGQAFTTNAGDQNCQWYTTDTVVNTGVTSSIRGLKEGEHYYKAPRSGKVPVGKWKVEYRSGLCIHNHYPPMGVPYHNIHFTRNTCGANHYSGWIGYCADCGESVTPMYFYMSKEAAASITELDLSLDYYYLCPFCSNLEQGAGFGRHSCNEISWNRYQVVYDCNSTEWVGGYMENSFHMYDDQDMYEGKIVTPNTRLHKNTYTRIGYEFIGWNTKADGSGTAFEDRAQIRNLTTENYDESGKGSVTLYAQWKKSVSTLNIDPAGGLYEGSSQITRVDGQYGTSVLLDSGKITPPQGNTIRFQVNGGETIEPITASCVFVEWVLQQPMSGRYRENRYYYTGANGASDTAQAIYRQEAVILPKAEKAGSSFGGWYYDEACEVPAGMEGDQLLLSKDLTLYAKWVDLVLYANNNDTANGGKGAVDLSWQQDDGVNKAYLLYQSTDQETWTQIADAEDIRNCISVERSFSFTGKEQIYEVPYTGIYVLTLEGAQGEGYGTFTGGYGGLVSGRVWLEKGERLSYRVGGTDGYPGGGTGSSYGNGGGYTSVTSDRKGLLMIAGGGGGATALSRGGAGGSQAGIVSSGFDGQSGHAGGGGGYKGGLAGNVNYHYHSDTCYITTDTSYTLMRNADYLSSWAKEYARLTPYYNVTGGHYGFGRSIWGAGAHGKEETAAVHIGLGEYWGDGYKRQVKYIPVNGNDTLQIHISADSWGSGGLRAGSMTVYDQNERVIFSKNLNSVKRYRDIDTSNQGTVNAFRNRFEQQTGGNRGNSSGWFFYSFGGSDYGTVYWNENVALPAGTTHVRINVYSDMGKNDAWFSATIHEIGFTGKKQVRTCAYAQNGQLVSANSAFGGSNYVNTEYVSSFSEVYGKNAGNGNFTIQSVNIGYQNELSLAGVKAQDMAAPDAIDLRTVQKSALSECAIQVRWSEPEDRGTLYYHKAESYFSGGTKRISQSNVTANCLATGVIGYCYTVDQKAETVVTMDSGAITYAENLQVEVAQDVQYLHIAAVDKAGNISETIHVMIGKKDEEIAWPIWTNQIQISSQDDAIHLASEGTYYVRADGKTPLWLGFEGYVAGRASVGYQINYLTFIMEENERRVEMDTYTPGVLSISNQTVTTEAADIIKTFSGRSLLLDDGYTVTRRSDQCKKLEIQQRFLVDPDLDGKKMQVIPSAGAAFYNEVIRSEMEKDKENSIWLIGDGRPPQVTGIDEWNFVMENQGIANNRTFSFDVSDSGSGVKECYAVITNQDNGQSRILYGTEGALIICVDLTDPLFQGDYTLE